MQILKKYLSIWWSDLTSMLPESVIEWFSGNDERIVIQYRDNGISEVFQCSQGKSTRLGEIATDPDSLYQYLETLINTQQGITTEAMVIVSLSEDRMLRQRVELPRKAYKNFRQVLNYEINKRTPFDSEDVYFDGIISQSTGTEDNLDTELIVTRKQEVDAIADAVGKAGLNLSAVTVQRGADDDYCQPPTVNFLPPDKRPVKAKTWVWYNKVAAVLLLFLFLAATILPFKIQSESIQRLEADISSFESQAAAARQLKDVISAQASELSTVIDLKEKYPAMIQVLNELSQILPEGTWLQRFEYNQSTIELHGESKAASELIGMMENSEYFQETRFLSQVVQNPRTGAERFQIECKLQAKEKP